MQNIFTKMKQEHIIRAIILQLVGFGSCMFMGLAKPLMIIPIATFLVSALYSLSSMIAVFRKKPELEDFYPLRVKIFTVIIGFFLLILSIFLTGLLLTLFIIN
ncbi:MAG: hypothetical protein KBC41_00410 [Candidatus Pacebacteria bacterium]|nr:hypothetical protein [Candidatus Paceibacterota bacterium]MBP9866528.1 hypothetical protein [Candidatus Paceibacterota bacterium]